MPSFSPRTHPTGGTGSTCSFAAGATRSRPVHRRSFATSSPSACSGCRGRGSTMDFAFTPEQEELRTQARAFLAANPEPSWQELADLGWTGVSVAEEHGGAGLGFLEEAILFEEMGRALTHAPYWSTVAVTLPALPADLQA